LFTADAFGASATVLGASAIFIEATIKAA